jgi:hypothetical protein
MSNTEVICVHQLNREVKTMSEALSREIRKLEIRLERFITEEKHFVKKLQSCLDKFRALNEILEQVTSDHRPEMIENLANLKETAIESLSETLKKNSDAEHEKSHLLESYGALMITSEKALKDVM